MTTDKEQKEYHIYGLSRSGNHAIIFWIIHNLVDEVHDVGNEIFIDQNYTLCYMNNVNIYNASAKIVRQNLPTNIFNYVIKSYEDIYFNQNVSFVILRDFINLLCSRYKKYKRNICLDTKYICDLLCLIDIWKQHAKKTRYSIYYNRWILSKEYRDTVSKNVVGIENKIDKIDYVSKIGDGSSFEQNPPELTVSYIERYKQVKLPKYMIEHILKDQNLIELNHKLFNIDIEKICYEYQS